MNPQREQPTAILQRAYDELYAGIVQNSYPAWFLNGMPEQDRTEFEQKKPSFKPLGFMAALNLKVGDELLHNNGNVVSVHWAARAIKQYGDFLAKRQFMAVFPADMTDHMLSLEETHRIIRTVNEKRPADDTLENILWAHFDSTFSADPSERPKEQAQLKEVMHVVSNAASTTEDIAAGLLTVKDGRLVTATKTREVKTHARIHQGSSMMGPGI